MQLLAFDPGTHTGFAWLQDDGRIRAVGTLFDLDRTMLYRYIHDLLGKFNYSVATDPDKGVVVIERFITVSPGVAASVDGILTQKLCGFIEGEAVLHGHEVVWHNSSVRKAYEDDAKRMLRESFPNRRPTPHEVSATAHGLSYLEHMRGPYATGAPATPRADV